jgi:DNA mismatch repair protein MutS2
VLKLPSSTENDSSLRRRRRARGLTVRDSGPTRKWYVSPVGTEPSDEDPEIPDILYQDRQRWGDLQGVAQLVRFAFEGGECTGAFDALLDATPLSPTSWHPSAFASHLFLEDLVRSNFPIEIDGKSIPVCQPLLVRLLSQPPSDAADTEARQRVFAELLEHPSTRADLERAYAAIRKLRSRLEGSPIDEADSVTRKMDVLSAVRDCIDTLADGFGEGSSVLSRLRETGRAYRGTEDYERLLQLLELEGNLATVDVRVQLGADGHVRGMHVLRVRENTDNPLLPSTWERVWQRVMGMLQGHRYGQREVLVALLHEVFRPLVDAVVTCLALSGAMEFYLAGLGFRDLAVGKGLAVSLAEIVDAPRPEDDKGIERVLEGVFNPLLILQDRTPVAADVRLERHDALVLLTGPNSGGKTRLLQAIAIIQCLGQAGMFVPARRATLVRAPTLFVSLVDEFDAAQSEGRLGTELIRIRKLFEELQPGAMAMLDELCSGTNPTEGEAIAEMVISLLPRLHPQVFISTHFLGLAQRLERERPVERLSFLEVELDEDNLPTYGFVPGVAKTSLAHMLAARLGVTREELEQIVDAKQAQSEA